MTRRPYRHRRHRAQVAAIMRRYWGLCGTIARQDRELRDLRRAHDEAREAAALILFHYGGLFEADDRALEMYGRPEMLGPVRRPDNPHIRRWEARMTGGCRS